MEQPNQAERGNMSDDSEGGSSINNLINDLAAVTAHDIGQWS
jgi:hypothetical protein